MTGIERHPKLEAVFAAAISLIAPVALYVINPAWAYAPPGWLDNYAPVAVALNYTDPTFWDGYYKISRMPWNMVEFVYRNLFSVDAAGIALHFSVLAATGLLSFMVGKRLFGRFAGLFLAVIVNALPFLIASDWTGGPDYQTSFAALMLLGFIASVTFYRPDHEKLPAFVAGVALMNAVLTISNYLQMAPLVLAITIAVLVSRKATAKSTAMVFAFGLFGAAATFIFWGFVSVAFGRPFAFFIPEFNLVFGMLTHPQMDVWWSPITSQDIRVYHHFGFLLAASSIALFDTGAITLRKQTRSNLVPLALHIGFLCEAAIWTYWQVFGHHTMLLPVYFATPLFLPAVLSMTAALFRDRIESTVSERAIFAVVAPVAFVLSNAHSLAIREAWGVVTNNSTLIIGVGVLLAYAALWAIPSRFGKAFALVASLTLPIAFGPSAYPNSFGVTSCRIRPQFNELITRAAYYARDQVDHIYKVSVWAPEGQPVTLPTSCHLTNPFTVSDVASSFAGLGMSMVSDDQIMDVVPRQEMIAVVSSDRADVQKIEAKLAAIGVRLEAAGEVALAESSALPSIYFLRVMPTK